MTLSRPDLVRSRLISPDLSDLIYIPSRQVVSDALEALKWGSAETAMVASSALLEAFNQREPDEDKGGASSLSAEELVDVQ